MWAEAAGSVEAVGVFQDDIQTTGQVITDDSSVASSASINMLW